MVVLSRIHPSLSIQSPSFFYSPTQHNTTSFVRQKNTQDNRSLLFFVVIKGPSSLGRFSIQLPTTTRNEPFLLVGGGGESGGRAARSTPRKVEERRGARVCAIRNPQQIRFSIGNVVCCCVSSRKFGDIYSSQARVYFCEKTRGGERKARQRNAKKAKR